MSNPLEHRDDLPLADDATSLQEEGPLATPEAPRAGFWVRVVASLIDSALLSIVQIVLGLLLAFAASAIIGDLDEEGQRFLFSAVWLFGTILGLGYYVFFTGYCGQTPGKMAVRVKVVRTDGSQLGYGRSFVREVPGKFLSGILLGAGYLMVAIDPGKEGLHDKIAGTCVVKIS